MPASRRLALPFVVTVAAALAGCSNGATSAADGGPRDDGSLGGSDGAADGAPPNVDCPATCAPGQACPAGGAADCPCTDPKTPVPAFEFCRSNAWCVYYENPPPPRPGDCPQALPTSGAACNVGGFAVCTYQCSGGAARSICQAGRWCGDTASNCHATGASACPSTPPVNGSACSESIICGNFPSCPFTQASCDGTKWTVSGAACPGDAGTD